MLTDREIRIASSVLAGSSGSATGSPATGRGKAIRAASAGEYVHVCIDDASRIVLTDIFPDEKAVSAVAFLKAALVYYRSLGITVARVMTDNGSCYKAKDFAKACNAPSLKHVRTKPYTPKTDGKAERFIQTALREWAYAGSYPSSNARKANLLIPRALSARRCPFRRTASLPPSVQRAIMRSSLLQLRRKGDFIPL